MKKDKLLVAAIIGGLSTLAGEIVTKILVACNIGEHAVYELNSLVVTSDTPSFIVGFIVNFIIGSYTGALFYLIFKKLGSEHLVVKCALGSLVLWLAFEVAFTFMIEGQYIPIRPVIDHIVHITGTLSFGITVGVLMRVFVFKRVEDKASG